MAADYLVGPLGFHALKGDNAINEIDAGFSQLVTDIEAKCALFYQDTLAKRGPAGTATRFFKATDTGQLFHDTGSVFEPLFGPGMQQGYTTETVPGFGPEKIYSATRWSFVVVSLSKPAPAVANAAAIQIDGITVGSLAIPVTAEGNVVSTTCSFFLPPNKQWTLSTGNLAACRPLTAAYVLL